MVFAEGLANHLCHFEQFKLSVIVFVELCEELLDHHSQLLVAYAH